MLFSNKLSINKLYDEAVQAARRGDPQDSLRLCAVGTGEPNDVPIR